ncbi:MAG TPA: hypothetical protein VGF12_07160 [Roseateles sp.]|uniref:hypothetical protein n=1 Tax=Roseateles sp. TaxID=1971397 RepID=UPI002ED922F4
MKERPIPFSAPMVRATRAGTKTQTRRIAKWCNVAAGLNMSFSGLRAVETPAGWVLESDTRTSSEWRCDPTPCPYGRPGDRLWVREAFRFPESLDHLSPSAVGDKALDAGYPKPWCPTQFEADGQRRTVQEWRDFVTPPTPNEPGRLRPPMFMPRWASRDTLDVNLVRVERLQSISREDALAEGIVKLKDGGYGLPAGEHYHFSDPRQSYFSLWEAINGPGSVEANPFVWVVGWHPLEADHG